MSIDTEITGSPASIRASAQWIRGTLATGIRAGADAFADSRTEAGGDWRGETGTEFVAAMGRAARMSDDVLSGTRDVEAVFNDYAGVLEVCQSRMQDIRTDARSAELTVSGFVVEPPATGPRTPELLRQRPRRDKSTATTAMSRRTTSTRRRSAPTTN